MKTKQPQAQQLTTPTPSTEPCLSMYFLNDSLPTTVTRHFAVHFCSQNLTHQSFKSNLNNFFFNKDIT